MDEQYKQTADRMSRFNQWEDQSQSDLSTEERLSRFFILMDFGHHLPPGIVERAHQEHLTSLIQVQKELRKP